MDQPSSLRLKPTYSETFPQQNPGGLAKLICCFALGFIALQSITIIWSVGFKISHQITGLFIGNLKVAPLYLNICYYC